MKTPEPEHDKVRLYFDGEFWGDADETILDVVRKQGYALKYSGIAGSTDMRVDATATKKRKIAPWG